jgi:hypothetical protein
MEDFLDDLEIPENEETPIEKKKDQQDESN